MIAAGVGCRSGCSAAEILDLLAEVQRECGVARVDVLATAESRAPEEGIRGAAAALGVPLRALPPASLEAASGAALTRSPRCQRTHGVPSVAETAALAAAGAGAVLLGPRRTSDRAACALARS